MFHQRRISQQSPIIKINGKTAKDLNKTNQIPKLDHVRFTLADENILDHSVDSSQANQNKPFASRIKLRDYIFQAETSARQKAAQKRKILQNLTCSRNKSQCQLNKLVMKQQAEYIKKNKYGIKNSEMFEILKKQVQNQIVSGIEQITSFNKQLNQQIRNCVVPSSGEMMMMYKLRSLLKDKLKGCIREMKQTLQNDKSERDVGVQVEIMLDQQELGRDIGFTEMMFSRKYLEIEEKRKEK